MSELERDTLLLTLKAASLSALVVVPIATVVAMWLMKLSSSKQIILLSILSLPMALPPVITGYLLLLVMGRQSFMGSYLFELFGVQVSFSFLGAVIASSFVSFPFALRSVVVALKSIDRTLIDAAVTLKISPLRTFIWIILPLSWPGILSAGILAFVRAFGEFGATAVFAGGIAGKSRTLSVTVWNLMQMPDQEETMWRLLSICVVFCFLALLLSEFLSRKTSILCNSR